MGTAQQAFITCPGDHEPFAKYFKLQLCRTSLYSEDSDRIVLGERFRHQEASVGVLFQRSDPINGDQTVAVARSTIFELARSS